MHSGSAKCQNFPACGGLTHPNTSKYYKMQLCSTESNAIEENRAPKAREIFSRKHPLLKKPPPLVLGGSENKGGVLKIECSGRENFEDWGSSNELFWCKFGIGKCIQAAQNPKKFPACGGLFQRFDPVFERFSAF